MSDDGAKSRHSGDNIQQQQQQQCNGILRPNMSDWAKKEEIAKRKNLRLQQVSANYIKSVSIVVVQWCTLNRNVIALFCLSRFVIFFLCFSSRLLGS